MVVVHCLGRLAFVDAVILFGEMIVGLVDAVHHNHRPGRRGRVAVGRTIQRRQPGFGHNRDFALFDYLPHSLDHDRLNLGRDRPSFADCTLNQLYIARDAVALRKQQLAPLTPGCCFFGAIIHPLIRFDG